MYAVSRQEEYSGNPCAQSAGDVDTADCNTHACPINCEGGWGDWGDCDVSCGGGTRDRTYAVTVPMEHSGTECPQFDGALQSQNCNEQACSPYEVAGTCAILGYRTSSSDDFRVVFLFSIPSGVPVHATDRGGNNDNLAGGDDGGSD
jgi:hypothetical protein